ncbi:DNA/RNA non-specific endonuclease [Mucilaginibacter ginkgonis]|uniref:DNA/RNA non-specific endonuclease n=1 Tax=Mucilaginibacter ginkgonis TaxID=2682091 RepID=A0A6I4IN59_9SPHI|nr:DNA/RNA non-specific endonuclease [Mucilaginibacter ginkgonis]QQL49361.1 DNA/RNA non-specific endonuclease [Mucilaginibacter ginkgonis]
MKKGFLLLTLAAATIFTSCKKDTALFTNPSDPSLTVTQTAYSVTEDFEQGTKAAYATADLTLKTGSWNFNDALIGNIAGDAKNGNWSIRLRAGSFSMNFDVANLDKIVFKHGKYGNDASSSWQLYMSRDKGKTYVQVGADYLETVNALATDSVSIASDGPVRFKFQKVGTAQTRLNFDDITFKGRGASGIVLTVPDTAPVDTASTAKATTPRGVTVGSDAPPATGDNSNLLFGNPSNATTTTAMLDNYLLDQGYYVESYSATRGTPNWVSWHLDNTNNTNATARLDNFAGFTGLPANDYVVQSNSYSGSGFDRGHNCPSADRTSSVNANSSTFLMTNMIPQAPQNNQQTWANLENYLRDQVTAGNEVYIIMGSYGTGGTGSLGSANTINNGHVTVPSNVWKVAVILPKGNGDLLRVSTTTRVIAVNTPNINTIDSDWNKYIVTVRSIETATGLNILSALPQSVQDAIEVKKDAGS